MSTSTSARNWTDLLRSGFVVAMLMLFGAVSALTSGSARAAAPAAGTVIGNQATATYLDATSTSRSASSNLVQTTVSQVKSFTLTANGAKTAAPGQTVYYPHTITNTGNGTDSYALNTATAGGTVTQTGLVYYIDANGDGVPDNFTPITTTGAIASGGQFQFVVAGTVPGTASSGQTGTITVSVSDTTPTTLTNLDTTTVQNSVINVTKAMGVTSGPSPSAAAITVTLSYTNSGSLAATNMVLTDLIPAGMTYVAGSGRWSVSGATALTDAAGGDPAGIAYDFGITTPTTVTATIANVGAGTSGTLTFQVNVNAGLAPTNAGNQALTTNTATYKSDQQTTPANTNSVTYTVAQTGSVVANNTSTAPTNGAPDNTVTVASASPGQTISFNDFVWNTGNGSDSFDITLSGSTYPAGTTFSLFQSDGVTSLIDNNGNGTPDTGPVAPGANYKVVVKANIPAGAGAGGPFTVTLTATSKFDPTKNDPVADVLTAIVANTVDLTNNVSVAGGATVAQGLGNTGTTVITTNNVTPSASSTTVTRFQLYVNNTSAISDSYNLSVAGTPAGWAVAFRNDGGANNCSTVGTTITTTGSIAANGNRLVCAEVTVPDTTTGNAATGTYNLDFTATSTTSPAVSDSKRDAVTVAAVHNVTLTPNGAQQTFPGGSVTYTHSLQNRGNVSENVTFTAGFLTNSQAAQGWTASAYIDGNGNGVFDPGVDDVPANLISTATTFALAANASRSIFVRVFAPGSATSASPANVSTLTATYNAGASTTSATDTTSVTDGLLLFKEQQLTGCAVAPGAAWSNAAIPAGPGTAPGQCIAYRITATNTTAANITSVTMSDIVPANTTVATGCGAPAATAPGTAPTGAVANGATGTITTTAATLTPSQSFVLTFCVKINP